MPDVIVTRDEGSGLGAGMVLGILIALLAIGFAIWYFGFGGAGTNDGSTDVNINNPQVNVQPQSS